MKNQKDHLDPRIQRTREYLREAFIELILDRGYRGITVTNLAERALINRSTFYLHYQGIDDLMTTGFRDYWDQVLPGSPLFIYHKPVLPADLLRATIESDLDHFDNLRDFYRVMLSGNEICRFRNNLSDHLLKITRERFTPPYSSSERPVLPLELTHTWAASAYLGLIHKWLQAEEPEPTTSLALKLSELFLRTFQAPLDQSESGIFDWSLEEGVYTGAVS